MHKTLGVRVSEEENKLLEDAMQLDNPLGQRGGIASWVRRAALREAKRIVSAVSLAPNNGEK